MEDIIEMSLLESHYLSTSYPGRLFVDPADLQFRVLADSVSLLSAGLKRVCYTHIIY